MNVSERLAGGALDPGGSGPFALDDPSCCYAIASGTVQIFLAELLEDGSTGSRYHLFEAAKGDLLFGLDAGEALSPVTVLALGTPDARLVALSRADVLKGAAAGLIGIERWVSQFSSAIARQIVPRPRADFTLVPETPVTVDAGGRATAAHEVTWCASMPGGLFVDVEQAGDGEDFLPVTPQSWITLPPGARLDVRSTARMIEDGILEAALDRFHRLAVDVLPMVLRLAAVDEYNRLRERAAGNARASDTGLRTLGAVLSRDRRQAAAIASDQPLVRAFTHLGTAIGFDVELPARRGDDDRPLGLEAVAQASRVRLRRVRIENGWWRRDSGAFLLVRPSGQTPLALVPAGRTYEIYDPDEGTPRRLGPDEAATLDGEAFVAYPPLQDEPVALPGLLRQVLHARRAELATIAGATLLAGILAMGVPLATTYLLQNIIPDNSLARVIQVGVALALAAVFTFVLQLSAQLALLRIEGLEGSRLQAAVMDRILRLPTGFFRGYTTGDMTTRVLAIARLEKALTASMVGSVMSGMVALVTYAAMLAYSWRLALVAIALTLVFAGLTLGLGLLRVRHEARAIGQDARMSGLTLELASGITKLRLAAAEDRAFLRWARLYADASRSHLDADRAAGVLDSISAAYPAFALCALFAACVLGGFAEGLGLGLLVAFIVAFSLALDSLKGVAGAAVEIAALGPVVGHAAPILAARPEVDTGKAEPGELSGAIELSRVTFRYGADAPNIFEDLSISIRPGEFVAFVGPSGTGKSTLLRLLLGFERPESGVVLYDGVDLAGLDVHSVRRQCGVVLQNGRLMPGTLMDNILGASSHLGPEAAWDAARQVALDRDIERMPMGMHTVVTDGGSSLSGGQVQRILLARAIVARPRIMMLDEATSALDNRTQAAVTESLNRVAGTRLVIAHRLSTVERADRIVVLNRGRVEEEGTYRELMARKGFFAAFAERQLTE